MLIEFYSEKKRVKFNKLIYCSFSYCAWSAAFPTLITVTIRCARHECIALRIRFRCVAPFAIGQANTAPCPAFALLAASFDAALLAIWYGHWRQANAVDYRHGCNSNEITLCSITTVHFKRIARWKNRPNTIWFSTHCTKIAHWTNTYYQGRNENFCIHSDGDTSRRSK